MEATNNVTTKGTTTIPKFVRDRLGITSDNKVRFYVDLQGKIVIEKALTLTDIRSQNKAFTGKVKLTPEQTARKLEELRGKELAEKYRAK